MNILDPREESSLKLYRWKKKNMFVLSPVFCIGQKKVWMDDWNNASLSLSLSFL